MEGGGLFSLRNKSLGGSKRIKISRACDECRKRKVKCDGVQPCGRCRKSNAECVFAKLPPKRGPPKQYMENLENRLQRVEKALKSMTAPVRKVFDDALATEKKKQQSQDMIPEVSSCNNKPSVSYSAPYTTDLNIAHIDRFTINEIGQAVYVNDLKVRIDRIPNENQHCSQQPPLAAAIHHHDTQSDIASISDSPISSSTASFFNHPTPTIVTTHAVSELPIPDHLSSRHLISEVQPLTEIYFDHVHKYVPMIHKPSFLKQMHSPTNPPSRFLLYAMCAVASRWSPDHISSTTKNNTTTDHVIPAGYTYYQRALELLDDFTDSPRIATVQALILLVKYQEYFQRTGYFHRSYFYLGMAVRMCFDLGLSQLDWDAYDAETKRRTFWVAFMYDLLMSIEQGHSTYFEAQKCKTGFPLVTGEEGPALEELITNQNIFIQLGKVLSDIYVMARRITLRQQLQGDKRSQEQIVEEQTRLFSLHTHLENFLYEVPPTLIYPPTQDTESYPAEKQLIGDPIIGFLHMTYHFSVILLHRIYLSHPPPKTEHNFITYPHRRLCAASASNITSIAETLYEMYPNYTFSYPARGVQHTIHCLATASTIHKYEMMNGEDETMRESAKQQYMLSLNMMQQLSNQSPSIEFSNYFNQPTPVAEKRISAPPLQHIQPPPSMYNNVPSSSSLEKSRVRRNTLSSATPMTMGEPALYQSSASITDPTHLANLLAQQQQQQQQQGYATAASQHQQQQQQQQQQQHHQHQPQQRYNTYPQMTTQQQQQWQLSPEDIQLNQYRRQQQFQQQQQMQMANNSWNQSQPQAPMYYNTQQQQQQQAYPTNNNIDIMIPSQQQQQQKQPYFSSSTRGGGGGRIRRHTVSNPSQQVQYYPSNMQQQQQEGKKPSNFDPTINMDMMLGSDGDAIMMDTVQQQHHYDPTPGMSQLFLTDDQQQQQSQQLAWDGSMISSSENGSGVQRSEGHVMK